MATKAVREALETREDITSLGMLNTHASMKRTMRAESDDYEHQMASAGKELWDDENNPPGDSKEDGDMEITGIRSPITINHNYPESEEKTAVTQAPPPQTQVVPQSSATQRPPSNTAKLPTWAKWAIPAAAAAGIGGAGVVGYKLAPDQPPAAAAGMTDVEKWSPPWIELPQPEGPPE